jgi:hypothetical protein
MFRFTDYQKFRAAYKALRDQKARQLMEARAWERMTTFQRVIKLAEQRKAKTWEQHFDVPRDVWRDSSRGEWVLVTYSDTGTKSTFEGELHSTRITIGRPTEVLAILAAAGLWDYGAVPPRIELPPALRFTKFCLRCESHKPVRAFSHDKRFSDGRHAYCDVCREELRRIPWYRGA